MNATLLSSYVNLCPECQQHDLFDDTNNSSMGYVNESSSAITIHENKSLDLFKFQPDTNSTFSFSRRQRQVPEPPALLLVTVTIMYVAIFVLGILGNIVVIAVVWYGRNIRCSVNMYLVNLCVADLLLLLICMPPALVELHAKDVWYFGEFLCKYSI